MPPRYPQPSQSHRIEVLHIYRHLLRQISYLPPAFSNVILTHVRTRFHDGTRLDTLTKGRVRTAKQALKNIRLANNGDAKRMSQLMHKGFGRSGLRRWQLFNEFKDKEGPSDSDALEALTSGERKLKKAEADQWEADLTEKERRRKERAEHFQKKFSHLTPAQKEAKVAQQERKAQIKTDAAPEPDNATLKHKWLEEWDRKKLQEFAKSQKAQSGRTPTVVWERGDTRNPNERHYIPEETTWGKAPKKSLIRSQLAKYWEAQSRKLLPPLSKGEFDLLDRLRSGAQLEGEWKMPKRRIPAKPQHEVEESETWSWEDFASKRTRSIEPGQRVKQSKRLGRLTSPFTGRTPQSTLSERWFQRQYQQIFLKSAYADQNPKTLKTQFTWGSYPTYTAAPKPHQMVFIDQKKRAPTLTSDGFKERVSHPTRYLYRERKTTALCPRDS